MHRLYALVFLSLFFSTVFVPFSTANAHDNGVEHEHTRVKQVVKENVRSDVDAAIKASRERRDEAREDLKEKLETVRDERKREIAENIDERVSALNEKWVSHFNNVLSRIGKLLAKIVTRAEGLDLSEADKAKVDSSIVSAQNAINGAQTVVNAQAEKKYSLDAANDSNIGEKVKALLSQFKSDISLVREAVNSARKGVEGAFDALKTVRE